MVNITSALMGLLVSSPLLLAVLRVCQRLSSDFRTLMDMEDL